MKAPRVLHCPLISPHRLSRKRKAAHNGTSKVLLTKLAIELDRLFWRKSDAIAEAKKIQLFLCAPGTPSVTKELQVEGLIRTLRKVPTPTQATISVVALDGSSHEVPIQPRFYTAVDLDADGGLHASIATVGDLKGKVQEMHGFRAVCQVLYSEGAELHGDFECALDNEQTLEEAGVAHGQTLYLVVDADRHYWQEHAQLVRSYKPVVIRVFKVMSAFKNEHGSAEARSRVLKFLKSCRKALAFLLENAAAHKARPMKTLRLVEGHLKTVVRPIFEAISLRERQYGHLCV